MKKREKHPTREEAEHLINLIREMKEHNLRVYREATEFRPGELTPEEEELVKQAGLNALDYVPQQVLQMQAEALARPKRPITSDDLFIKGLKDRFDGFGYGMFLVAIAGVAAFIRNAYGWPMCLFSFSLMVCILELSYRLSKR